MKPGNRRAARVFRLGLAVACLAAAATSHSAQSSRNAPPRPPAAGSTQETEEQLAALLQRANEAIDKMDFAPAIDFLRQYISQRPDAPYAHFQLGYAYAGLKHLDDAAHEFSQALALDPKMTAAYQNLGLALMDSNPEDAAHAFLHAADLQPTESRPRFLAGVCLERSGKFPEAVQQYRSALALSPKDYEAHFSLGRTLLRASDPAGAESEFRAAIESKGDAAPAHLGLGSALLAQKKYALADEAFAEYLKLNPGDRSARFDRAEALVNLNRYDEALAELDRAESGASPTADMLKMRGEIYMQQKKWKEAESVLAQAIPLASPDPELGAWLGHVDIELHDYPSAIRILGQTYAADPQSTDALRDLADAYFLNQNYSEALSAMDRLATLESPPPGSWFVRAICYDKLSRKAEAIEAYQKFLDADGGQHDTQDFQARHRIITLQNELGQTTKKQRP